MGRLKSVRPRLAVASSAARRLSVVGGGVAGSARSVKGSSSAARGYGYRWRQARAAFLAENPLCVMCSTPFSPVAATVVDHIKPHGGDDALFWDKNNWQPLCKRCHDSTKQRAENAARRGGVAKS